jgi:hypothetical protein
MRLRTALVVAALLAAGCGPFGRSVHIDYVDFIRWGGLDYMAVWGPGRALTDADLGPVQFHVRTMLSAAGQGPEYQPKDGDAAYVPNGTPVYAVRGYATTFRLAARHDGRLVLYELSDNPGARTGRDLLDIGGKVGAIAMTSKTDGRTVLGRIGDATQVATLVNLVLDAPVDGQRHGELAGFVSFELRDGTATTQAYFRNVPMLARGILVPREFAAAMDELLANAPTPTPIPAAVNLTQRYGLANAIRVSIKRQDPPMGVLQDPAVVQKFAAALDVDLTTRPAPALPSNYTIVIFEFSDHYVSLIYDPPGNTVTVVVPADAFAVRPTSQFTELVRTAR